MTEVALIIPTLNGGTVFQRLMASVSTQIYQPVTKLVIDSTSSDDTVSIASDAGFRIMKIKREDFNHGATRQLGVDTAIADAEIIVFLTQDVILANPSALANLIKCFDDPKVGACYGRQLPHLDATPIAAHARLFNYPETSLIKSMGDASRLGIKTAFISNSFAAYRREALKSAGEFPSNVILGEDTYVAARMLVNGWRIAYCADAQVYHSHNYSYMEEFRRYFDTGVFHAREKWIREHFGQAEGEGKRYVISELSYLKNNASLLNIPCALLRTTLKYLGYKLGLFEAHIPIGIIKHLSMHKKFWR
jgi:rhamnosyltransferase